jgi:hypothetical protein
MATITALDEPFEGTAGVDLTTSNSKVDSFSGSTSAASKFTATHYSGSTSCEVNVAGSSRIMEFDFTSAGLVHLDLYVDVAVVPSATSAVINWYDGTTKVGEIRLLRVSATTFQFQIRDASTSKWIGSVLPQGQYRLAIKIDPGSATGHSVKVFTGSSIDTSPVETSGGVTATTAGASTVDNIRIGVMSGVTATIRYDGMTADDAAEVVRDTPSTVTTLPLKVRVGGAWVTPTVKTRVNGAWV